MSRRKLLAAHWLCSFVIFSAFFLSLSVIWDGDSYYHLAVSRYLLQHGPAAVVPWGRFSLVGNGSDKDWLFHILTMPFAAFPDASIGGRIALGAWNATLTTAVAAVTWDAVGAAALFVPIWLWVAAPPLFARVVRLRPELLALLALMLMTRAAAKRRYALLALLSFAFAFGYTAFHVVLALSVAWCIWSWYRTRTPDFGIVFATFGGVAAGLILRPHPLANLYFWYVQNVQFFRVGQALDVGNEILPPQWPELWSCAAWVAFVVALIVIARTSRARQESRRDDFVWYLAINAAVFLALYVRMERMGLYLFPFATLAAIHAFAPQISRRVFAIVLVVTFIAALPLEFGPDKREFIHVRMADVSELDWSEFGRAVPPGAHVAASWGDAESYTFWAPQGRYLNVLDPIFMALPYPRQYDAQARIFAGHDPDFPRTLVRELDSDYLGLDWTHAPSAFVERLRNDPRVENVYGGYNALFKITPPRATRFVTDWSPLRPGTDPLAGFVDATAIATPCATLTHFENASDRAQHRYEFTGWGPSTLAIDRTAKAATPTPLYAMLGHGARFEIVLDPGIHRFDVQTCRSGERAGFFLKESIARDRQPSASTAPGTPSQSRPQ